jgi:ribosomal protein S18 acetylase RimI-like enzyme
MAKHSLLTEDTDGQTILDNISERMAIDCYDWILLAERKGKAVGWLAFYRIPDSGVAQIWNWHPVVSPNKHETETAKDLIREALSHLRGIGIHKVTVDFHRIERAPSSFDKYLSWYSQAGITETIEENYYRKDIDEGNFEPLIPDGYSLGRVSEAGLDTLFSCWIRVFSSSDDQFIQSLDAEGKRDFFFRSWSKEKSLIDEASLTLCHEDKLIGFSRLLPVYESTDGYLAPIGILPEYRRRGLARELLNASMLKLQELGYQTISCFVSTNNVAAVSFYEELGFTCTSRIASLSGDIVKLSDQP